MNDYVADTHALYWYLINSPLLGANASQAFNEEDKDLTIDKEIVSSGIVTTVW